MTDADREELHPPSGDDVSGISASDPPDEPDVDPYEPDIEIVARVRADELRFDAEPEVEIRFPGSGQRDSRQLTTRKNIDEPIDTFIPAQLSANRFSLLEISFRHTARVAKLPFRHRDPFDRLLVAQALEDGLTIVTSDPVFPKYGVKQLW